MILDHNVYNDHCVLSDIYSDERSMVDLMYFSQTVSESLQRLMVACIKIVQSSLSVPIYIISIYCVREIHWCFL